MCFLSFYLFYFRSLSSANHFFILDYPISTNSFIYKLVLPPDFDPLFLPRPYEYPKSCFVTLGCLPEFSIIGPDYRFDPRLLVYFKLKEHFFWCNAAYAPIFDFTNIFSKLTKDDILHVVTSSKDVSFFVDFLNEHQDKTINLLSASEIPKH